MKPTARLHNNELVLENSRILRRFSWDQGNLRTLEIVDKRNGKSWAASGDAAPDFSIPGLPAMESAELQIRETPADPIRPMHLTAEVHSRAGALEVRRTFRLYEDCPAIAMGIDLKGAASGAWLPSGGDPVGRRNIEDSWLLGNRQSLPMPILDRITTSRPHLRLTCVQFQDVSDYRNTFVFEQSLIPYLRFSNFTGNLLLVRDPLDHAGLFILKEAPCSDSQLAWPGADFIVNKAEVLTVGLGLIPADLKPEEWIRGYGCVLGVATDGEFELLSALRDYQKRVRIHQPGRDSMIMLNTWGDRGMDKHIGEAFAIAELEAGARLGVSHFQLDAGWQSGKLDDKGYCSGAFQNIWDCPRYWTPHPGRFPNGLGPVVRRSRELGIELCAWFNPSVEGGFQHWADDAGVLIGLYREHGIRTFKIDGVEIPDKTAEGNFRRFLDRVLDATDRRAVFNLDVTAGQRLGYHYGNEYGNVFVENRYTDWSNYYPHHTLRNLWMLSRYVPPQHLQMEFLNVWRNPQCYRPDDPLAPRHVPFDYAFAVTMMAQPLAWFEAAQLPEAAFDIAALVRRYRELQAELHSGQIFPIGREPSGTGWTGFQSVLDARSGFLLVFRELTDHASESLAPWNLNGRRLILRHQLGHGVDFAAQVAERGALVFTLPRPSTFALYRYEVSD